MKLIGALGVLFAWIFLVLLVWQSNIDERVPVPPDYEIHQAHKVIKGVRVVFVGEDVGGIEIVGESEFVIVNNNITYP